MWVSFILLLLLASCGANVEPSSCGDAITLAVSDRASLTSFLVILLFGLVTSLTSGSSTEDSSSEEEEPVMTQQPGTEVKWEFVRTGKSVEGKPRRRRPTGAGSNF